MRTERILLQEVPQDYYFKFPSGKKVYQLVNHDAYRGAFYIDEKGKEYFKYYNPGHKFVDVFIERGGYKW